MKQRGFTLVEMLISATLLMIVLGTAMYGYQLYMQYWQREKAQYSTQFAEYRNTDLFYTALRGIVPYAVQQEELYAFYFLGRDNGFTAVTQTPIFNPDGLAVIRVFREVGKQGHIRLVYEEASLKDSLLLEAEQELPFNHRMVVSDSMLAVEFLYLRYEYKINDEFPEQTDKIRVWESTLDGLKQGVHPIQIRLQLNNLVMNVPVSDRQNLLLRRYQKGELAI